MEDSKDLISNKTIAVQIADRIRDDILSRAIAPGSRITVKEIADRYNVSAMPVREAFNMLCGEQFLELNPYKGATVMALTPELMAQLNDMQGALESLLVELCLQKGYPDELLDQLEAINQELANLDEQGVAYALYSDNTAKVIGCPDGLTGITIPATVEGYAVTEIADRAFQNRSMITSITMPSGLLKIGDYAFAYTKLSQIDLSHVQSIGAYAFYNCSGLTGPLTIPDSVTSIVDWAFLDCTGLTSVTIGNSVVCINSNSFSVIINSEKEAFVFFPTFLHSTNPAIA